MEIHDWIEVTTLSDPSRIFVCGDPWCDEQKIEPREPVEPWTGPRWGSLPRA